ncbi:MAG TPA: N-acetylmuramoyl-L-alanine amidase [Verrucomicrobiales bacterium]|nr:N-acetylmuramoyl-L-alanine amidase [Verrucomicrobiales bacterium]
MFAFRFLTAVLFLGLSGLASGAGGTVVVLDPGHGGRDRGTMWGGVSEKVLTLSIARRVEQYLKARGIRTVMTRRSDVYRSLESRAAMANGYGRSVFVSIHCNADPRFCARGIETFYNGAQGCRLASCIHAFLDTRTSAPDRGVKFAGFAVLRKTCCPAALVECGFLTSPSERRLLVTPLYQNRVAKAIADGIFRSVDR